MVIVIDCYEPCLIYELRGLEYIVHALQTKRFRSLFTFSVSGKCERLVKEFHMLVTPFIILRVMLYAMLLYS